MLVEAFDDEIQAKAGQNTGIAEVLQEIWTPVLQKALQKVLGPVLHWVPRPKPNAASSGVGRQRWIPHLIQNLTIQSHRI